jgi:ATP-binding cassette subfamily F protein uup
MANPYLDIQHLTKRIGSLLLFEDISFSLAEGDRVGLIARNGTGKSTLLNIIAGLDDYESGEIVFRNNIRVGYLPQNPQFDATETVLEAVTKGTDCILDAENMSDESDAKISAKQILTKIFPSFCLRNTSHYGVLTRFFKT